MVNSLVGAFRGNASFRPRAEPRDKQRTEGDDAKWYCELDESGDGSSPNGRFLRHRFSPKPKVIATPISLPKRNHVAKEAVSTALQTNARQRSDKRGKPNDAPTTKPWPCVKTMLGDRRLWPVMVEIANQFMGIVIDLEPMPKVCISENS